ncbi:TPR domain [Lecanosticta acicola]|uniref:TPR domain n=1 Tax=Lecanosticta acicola TaxID=111012 RepID=A0AAI9E6C0_9PEZI|nr:TPR domain [Lecanosticta acicola]
MKAPNLQYNDAAMQQEPYFDLGTYTRSISTKSKSAQSWFDRGWKWAYGFNHEEAIRCFERASREDPDCALPLFGSAYCLGPNYNKPWEVFDDDERAANLRRARSALMEAKEKGSSSPVESALVAALEHRYSQDVAGTESEAYAIWNKDYAEAMSRVYQQYGEDLDVAALYADALMNLTPWVLWDLRTGEPTDGSRTLEAKEVLERAIAQPEGDEHPGLLHLYIHLMEMSAHPEAAISIAVRLRGLVPDAGHLHHMPTHLDVLCGDWERAIVSNSEAILADERYLARAGALNFYSLYRSHNYHFRIYAAMFAGQFRVAMETVEMLDASLPEQLLRVESPPMADWLESFLAMRVHVFIRFGRWSDILELELPKDRNLYCVTTAMIHYAKGVAYAVTDKVKDAERVRRLFHDAVSKVPPSRTLFNNTAVDILGVAAAMLNGELEYRLANIDLGFEYLRQAVDLSDNLPYDEPWGWMQPPRHAYGALLLEQDRIEEATAVYEADLGLNDTLPRALRHPNNIWALHGLHECVKRSHRDEEAEKIRPMLEDCQAKADVPISSSCFCRTEMSR